MKKVSEKNRVVSFLVWIRQASLDRTVLILIRAYQRTLSPDHGPMRHNHPVGFCRFYPSCSEYGYRAVKRCGVFVGGALSIWRVLRCNPFSRGGIDDVPKLSKEAR